MKLRTYIILILCFIHTPLYGQLNIFWVDNLEHHYDKSAKTQAEWCSTYNIFSFVNGSFFHSNNTIIPPFATKTSKSISSNTKKWWYIQRTESMVYGYGSLLYKQCYSLHPPSVKPTQLSSFIVSVCPPLIHNEADISKNAIYKIGGKKFSKRQCRRTMIGKTNTGVMFIVVSSGSLLNVRKRIRNRIKNIQWLANLDGGSSTFATAFGNYVIRHKRKIPSIISYSIHKWEI